MSDVRGRFVWHELMTSDPQAAIPFYTDVVGWSTQSMDMGPNGTYTMWTNGGQPNGGTMRLPEEAKAMGAPPHWLPYIGTTDLKATVARAQELGATVHVPPTDIPNIGAFAVLADPQGATFAVYTSANPANQGAESTGIGEFSWHELLTTNWEQALAFYSDLFGWVKVDTMDMGPQGTYLIYGLGGVPMGGIMNKPAEMPMAAWLCYAHVADLDGALAKAQAHGAKVLNGPMEVPGGDRIVQFLDPQGAAVALHASAPKAEA